MRVHWMTWRLDGPTHERCTGHSVPCVGSVESEGSTASSRRVLRCTYWCSRGRECGGEVGTKLNIGMNTTPNNTRTHACIHIQPARPSLTHTHTPTHTLMSPPLHLYLHQLTLILKATPTLISVPFHLYPHKPALILTPTPTLVSPPLHTLSYRSLKHINFILARQLYVRDLLHTTTKAKMLPVYVDSVNITSIIISLTVIQIITLVLSILLLSTDIFLFLHRFLFSALTTWI